MNWSSHSWVATYSVGLYQAIQVREFGPVGFWEAVRAASRIRSEDRRANDIQLFQRGDLLGNYSAGIEESEFSRILQTAEA